MAQTAAPRPLPVPPIAAEWTLPAGWRTLEFISDLHLQASEPATVQAFRSYLAATRADAVFLLGDLFEVWVGDDALLEPGSFEAECATAMRAAATRTPLFFMQGNRDFLTGAQFDALCGTTTLTDPTVLDCGDQRILLSHGDALCLDDVDYQRFRAMARSAAWQAGFLAQPLQVRRDQARGIRQESESRKRESDGHGAAMPTYADLDAQATRSWLHAAGAATLIHGHTHRPADHELGDGLRRIVLNDWDLAAPVPRAEVLRWERGMGLRRLPLSDVLEQASPP
ncbi:UDP-2,3-diacylglucosamine diphosphatase [Delftia acidovorans]|uniref:UDP-2,3-diacylglucosamine diphosphatase n=1 Tax=Delftia acidovorans TaxID=80866 RepID=UPI001EFDECAA|nr:UDP-2,3-diacylglucosamine diphosphatase [Delftia acidovorans]MCG8990527.1 UDP-2,3-diacylglucosamine diphosphatase [Delftia acidovorans]